MSYVWTGSRRGLGTAAQAGADVQIGGSLATGAGTAVLSTIAASGGSVLGLTGAALTAAIPIVGAALAGVTLLVQYLVANSGCGQTCIETSSWANQAAAQLDKNIHGYFALPTPRPKSAQTLALANFNTLWNQLVQLCQQPGTGTAGQRCISDRQEGACTWKQTAAALPPWGTPAVGECWNWWNGYYLPIANDPNVYDDSVTAQVSNAVAGTTATGAPAAGDTVVAGVDLSTIPWYVWAGVGLAAVLVVSE